MSQNDMEFFKGLADPTIDQARKSIDDLAEVTGYLILEFVKNGWNLQSAQTVAFCMTCQMAGINVMEASTVLDSIVRSQGYNTSLSLGTDLTGGPNQDGGLVWSVNAEMSDDYDDDDEEDDDDSNDD
jgi:hypothetical protein